MLSSSVVETSPKRFIVLCVYVKLFDLGLLNGTIRPPFLKTGIIGE